MLLVAFCNCGAEIAHAGTGDWQGCDSIRESKKRNLYLGTVSVFPSSFQIEGKQIEFQEAWLEECLVRPGDWKEKGQGYWLCFTVLIDGTREIGSFGNGSTLDFVPTAHLSYGRFVDYKKATSAKIALFGRTGFPPGFVRHIILLPTTNLPNEVAARTTFTPFKTNVILVPTKFPKETGKEIATSNDNGNAEFRAHSPEVTFHLPHLK